MSDRIFNRFAAASRRGFVKGAGVAAAAGAMAGHLLRAPRARGASTQDVLRVGLVGCGGRGTGAAAQALAADKNVQLVALGDVFADRLESSLALLQKKEEVASRIDVPKERRFVGFDAYKGVIDSGIDVILLTTPPHFRPLHMQAAVDAGKHVFAEKPVAVDAPGVRKVLAACADAKKKNLSVLSGLCWRYHQPHVETIRRVHDGAIGEIRAIFANDFRGPIWAKPRKPGWSDMEYQMHNWYYFPWISGDFNVEQHVHLLDTCSWALKGQYPVKAYGTGGRAWRNDAETGTIYDHHAVTFEFANGMKLMSHCRQYSGCLNNTEVTLVGVKGEAAVVTPDLRITTGKRTWKPREDKSDKYQSEHDALFAALRRGQRIDNGDYMAKSTLMGIMGRMASYTGQLITWDQAMDSKEDLSPAKYEWGALPPPVIAVPGPKA